jgi:hypothetical protein
MARDPFTDFFAVLERTLLLCGVCLALLFMATHAMGCAPLVTSHGRTAHIDPDVDDNLGGTGIESGDIRGASERVARRIVGIEHDEDTPKRPRIAMLPVANLTRFRIDPGLLRNRLTHELVNRARGRFTLIPVDGADGARVDYVLKTELRSEMKDSREADATSDYVQYTFTLERPTDGAVLFSEIYETKRVSSVDVIYQ